MIAEISDAWLVARERLLPRRHLVEHAPEREDVRPRVGLLALELLRRHVLERPEDRAFLRQRACCVGSAVRLDCGAAGAIAFASPKSSSFTPDFVSITLPGFRSRCTIPCRCALSSASAISIAVAQRLLERQRPLRQPIRQRLALQVLHDQVLGLALAAHVVERADVRVRELRDRLRLPLEPLPRPRATPTGATAAP